VGSRQQRPDRQPRVVLMAMSRPPVTKTILCRGNNDRVYQDETDGGGGVAYRWTGCVLPSSVMFGSSPHCRPDYSGQGFYLGSNGARRIQIPPDGWKHTWSAAWALANDLGREPSLPLAVKIRGMENSW
jgi:hypothetical protein